MAAQALTLAPLAALAQGVSGSNLGGITNLFNNFIGFINGTLIPLVFALALLMFFYGIFKYFILGGGDQGSRDEGKQLMLWAIIGFVVMAGIYGIIQVITGGLGINNSTAPVLPTAPGGNMGNMNGYGVNSYGEATIVR